MRTQLLAGLLVLALAGCGSREPVAKDAGTARITDVAPLAQTVASPENDGNDVAFWLHPQDAARSLVLGTGGTAGLELYSLDGQRLSAYPDIQPDNLTVSHDLVIASDRRSAGLVVLAIDPASLAVQRLTRDALPVHGEVNGLCAYRSPDTGLQYVFAVVEGNVQQWQLRRSGAAVQGALVRTVPVGVGSGYCAVDDASRTLFVAEETVGIWRIAAEPETDAERKAVDLVAPTGHIEDEVKGLAVYRAGADKAYLLAADIKPGRFNVYDLADDSWLGSFRIIATDTIDAVGESEGLAATTLPLAGSAGGLVATFDEENLSGSGDIKIVAWDAIAQGLGLAASADADPRVLPAPVARTVMPTVETVPVGNYGDAADDPAIWVHPTDPSKSLVIATNKKLGIDVYDLAGKRLQSLPVGRVNNVDLREGFLLDGKPVTLVAASNRTTLGISVFRVDTAARRLVEVGDGTLPTALADPYGLCMYRSAKSGETYVFINDNNDTGTMRQWRFVDAGGKVGAEVIRSFDVGSLAEGCVADDETGALYVAEEDVALWRYSAEPDGGAERRQVGKVGPGELTDDAEGVSIWAGPNGTGYIVLSNQGADNYAVFRREGDNAFVGFFSIVANEALGIDGASETDGLDVTSAPLGPKYPKGLLVVQDGRNIGPNEPQNFKYVSWADVLQALGE
ncbi:MAG: phytase [Steroidobacteraceae bacterium]|nr:phytase [Steroidobacteraceae bacterium]